MEPGAIVGIVLDLVALLLIVVYIVYMYWWKPHQNKSTHHEGKLDLEFDEKTRRRLMANYELEEDGNVVMNLSELP